MDRFKQYHSERYNTEMISDTSMLSSEDKEIVTLALNKTWTNPKFKLKWFVGEMQITPFAKMRQWLMEIKIKEEVIDFMEYEMNKLEIKIKRHKRLMENVLDELDQEEAELENLKLEFDRKLNRRRLQDAYLERQHLIDILNEFLESPESKLEDGRSLLDIIDTEEEEIYESQYWTARLAKQAAMDILAYGRIGVGNMEALTQLSTAQQTEALALAHRYALQLDNHQGAIRQEMAKQLGLPDNYVPVVGLQQTSEIVTKYVDKEKIEESPKPEDLQNVYRI